MASRMSKPLLFSKAPPSGILFDHAKRLGTGGIRVEMQYDTSQAPEMELGATKQKVLIQSARLRRATPVYSDKFKKVCAIHRRSHTHTDVFILSAVDRSGAASARWGGGRTS